MIITDGVHLISTESEAELHEFAAKIGLKREWYQDNSRHPHYDLIGRRMKGKALAAGAKMITKRELATLAKGRE